MLGAIHDPHRPAPELLAHQVAVERDLAGREPAHAPRAERPPGLGPAARAAGGAARLPAPLAAAARARELAQKIAENAPLGVAAAKRAIQIGKDSDAHTAAAFEARAFASLFDSTDAKTGIAAFLAKERSVQFKGR